MITDLTFITNEYNQTHKDRFHVLIRDGRFFDCLVGYFYTSGFHAIYLPWNKQKKSEAIGWFTSYTASPKPKSPSSRGGRA